MNKMYETQLKDTSGVTHVYMRGPLKELIDRIIVFPTDDIPMMVEEQERENEYWVHFVLL